MISIFNYSTFSTHLNKKTHSLHLSFKKEHSYYLNFEVLFEFESLLTWLASRSEIHSIIINSESGHFFQSIEKGSLKELKRERLLQYYEKVSKLGFAMRHIPQTVIIDLGSEVSNIGLELALGADIRLARQDIKVNFDHLRKGIVPVSGIFSMLTQLVGHARAKSWILASKSVDASELIQSGLVSELYSPEQEVFDVYLPLLECIESQAPVCRIQSKLALLEMERSFLERGMEFSQSIGNAASANEDWRAEQHEEDHFMSAKSMGQVVKLSEVRKQRERSQ